MVIDLTETQFCPIPNSYSLPPCFVENFLPTVKCWIAEDRRLPKSWKKTMQKWEYLTPKVQASFLSLWASVPDENKAKIIRSASNPLFVNIVDEKRACRYVGSPTNGVVQRIHRALQQRFFLISQEDSSTDDNVHRTFVVLGSTGNVYNVDIRKHSSCTCPDHGKSHPCKHILFVLLKVLRVSPRSHLVYQKALLQVELREIFRHADEITHCSVQAKNEVVRAYNERMSVSGNSSNSADAVAINALRLEPEGECAICFDIMTGKDTVKMCSTCKNFLHQECLEKWLSQSATCCYCRSVWPVALSEGRGSKSSAAERAGEGFLNLGALQGMSGERDTTTYRESHWGEYGVKKRRYY